MKKIIEFISAHILIGIGFLAVIAILWLGAAIIIPYLQQDRLSEFSGGSIDTTIEKDKFRVVINFPTSKFYQDDSTNTATVTVIDTTDNSKIVSFEVDFVPGKFRWACGKADELTNYQNKLSYPVDEIIEEYCGQKLKSASGHKIQAVLCIGLASQEGVEHEQESLSLKRANAIYDQVSSFLAREHLQTTIIKLNFGKYEGEEVDKCDKKTENQRLVAIVRVYDCKFPIPGKQYQLFQDLFHKVFTDSHLQGKIPLDGNKYSLFQSKNDFIERYNLNN